MTSETSEKIDLLLSQIKAALETAEALKQTRQQVLHSVLFSPRSIWHRQGLDDTTVATGTVYIPHALPLGTPLYMGDQVAGYVSCVMRVTGDDSTFRTDIRLADPKSFEVYPALRDVQYELTYAVAAR